MRILKALSALLCYPDETLRDAAPEIAAELAAHPAVLPLARALARADLFDLQSDYVDLFDRGRRISLHLFEHIHGESRDRGQAMVDLAQVYEAGGLLLAPGELPDYLPLFLEYAATRPEAEARALIGEIAPILTALHDATRARNTPYAAVFAALLGVAGAAQSVSSPKAEEPEDIDAAWEETMVQFGPGEDVAGCSPDRLRRRLRAAGRDARQMEPTP
jgi:nitrate reductase delta subunit